MTRAAPSFPPAIYDGESLFLLAAGPASSPDGSFCARYTQYDEEGGRLGQVDINEEALGGNEAPVRAAFGL